VALYLQLWPYLQCLPVDNLSIVSQDVHSATIQFSYNADCQT